MNRIRVCLCVCACVLMCMICSKHLFNITHGVLMQEIADKTRELLNNLKTLGTTDADGNVSISAEQLREKRLPRATENFLLGLAAAEGLLLL